METQYEYEAMNCDEVDSPVAHMNNMGAEGWRLITINNNVMIFERKIHIGELR